MDDLLKINRKTVEIKSMHENARKRHLATRAATNQNLLHGIDAITMPRLHLVEPNVWMMMHLSKLLIKDKALLGSAAAVINCCKTLDDLTEKLKYLGYDLSRSSVYLRLLPRRKDSIEGKRHRMVANVKFCCAQRMQRAQNPDRWFASATMHRVEDFSVLLGAENVAFLGKDDKVLITSGILAAKPTESHFNVYGIPRYPP